METTTTLPCWSARHWVSTWRGLSRNFSTRHSPRPKAVTASRTADSKASGISSSVRATLRPRPPPPKTALIAIGRPNSSANSTASSASLSGVLGAGGERRVGLHRDVLGLGLVAQRLDRGGRRADPGQPGVDDGLGELGVLGQEAVAGVHRVGAGLLGHRDDLGDVEVGVGRGRAAQRVRLVGEPDEQRVPVGVGVDGDAADPGVLAGPDHPDRDLAAVGDQDLLQRLAVGHGAQVIAPEATVGERRDPRRCGVGVRAPAGRKPAGATRSLRSARLWRGCRDDVTVSLNSPHW